MSLRSVMLPPLSRGMAATMVLRTLLMMPSATALRESLPFSFSFRAMASRMPVAGPGAEDQFQSCHAIVAHEQKTAAAECLMNGNQAYRKRRQPNV